MNTNIFYVALTQPLANGLAISYKLLFSNLGLAIIGFSVFVTVILLPLSKKYMDSMKKMKEFGPQIEKIKAKHKDDKQKQTQAIAEFYKSKGINPGAGCLPMILRLVILFAFFRVFTLVLTGDNIVANFNAVLYPGIKFAEDSVISTKFLYLNLTKPDTFQIPGLPFALPGLTLILGAAAQFLGAKMSQPQIKDDREAAAGTKGAGDDLQVAMQNSMIYTFPLITLLAGMRFPAGLALYWLVISIFQVVQQSSSISLSGVLKSAKHGGQKDTQTK